MAGKPKPRSARESTGTVALPRSVLLEVDRFITENPEFGIKDRNDFARRAFALQMKELRNEVYQRLLLEAQRETPGTLAQLRNDGFKM